MRLYLGSGGKGDFGYLSTEELNARVKRKGWRKPVKGYDRSQQTFLSQMPREGRKNLDTREG